MRGCVTAILVAWCLLQTATTVTAQDLPQVAPGGVVRWPGSDIDRCGWDEEVFAPAAEACYFPVDLLAAPGPRQVWRERQGRRETASFTVSAYPYPVQHLTLADDSYVDLSASDLARVRRENAQIAQLWQRRDGALPPLPLAAPLQPLPPGGRFGSRRIINNQPRNPHSGADYAAPEGTPVLAVADGIAVLVDEHFFAGKSVYLDHGDGLISMYFHLAATAVTQGESVRRGQPIGSVGASGRATGPHLHFGLRWRGRRIDPAALLGPPEALPQPIAALSEQ